MQFKIIKESIIDKPQEKMNPYIWDKNGIFNTIIKEKIINILENKNIKYNSLLLIGSLTTKFWTDYSDLDITVFCDADDNILASYIATSKIINERYFFGTFPINFYFRNDNIEQLGEFFSDGIYDILKDSWVKTPTDINDIENILKNPLILAQKIARKLDLELDDISADVNDIVNNLNNNSNNFTDKLNLIDLQINEYIDQLDRIHKKRIEEFSKSLESDEYDLVKKYKSRNLLPYNIIYKYLVKHLYYKWSKVFETSKKDSLLNTNEIKKIFNNFVKFWD